MDIDLQGVISGKKRAFEDIYNKYFDLLFYLAVGYVNDYTRAEDLVHDAFIKLWERRKDLYSDSNVKNLLYTITKHNCLNHLRQQEIIAKNCRDYLIPELKYRQEALDNFANSFEDVESLLVIVERAIDNLPEDIRMVFKMNRFENLTYREIASKLDVSPKTVEARISKALKLLRVELKDYLPLAQLMFWFLR
ncbi:RNA polymerase sigma-70 factor [Marinilabiliaceae bacterium ANBcel2]|nr:RNA polymerase sigma-70 factor [Marinilabiliaceae bacterium ANBcel2]